MTRIELAPQAWEASVLPLNYICVCNAFDIVIRARFYSLQYFKGLHQLDNCVSNRYR